MAEYNPTMKIDQGVTGLPPAKPNKNVPAREGFTPEMLEVVEQLANPKGDPYTNARRLGFYCEQCG